MPEKSTKKKKNKEGCSNDDNYKRKNSINSESTISSRNSSTTSNNSTDSEDSSASGEKEKSTMTKSGPENEEGSSTTVVGGFTVSMKDRFSDLINASSSDNEQTGKMAPVQIVNSGDEIPISEHTHMRVIPQDEINSGPSSENGQSVAILLAPTMPKTKKKNQKEKKLTKKELKKRDQDSNLFFHRLDDQISEVPSGSMMVRAKNDAARVALGQQQVSMPFYGQTVENGTIRKPIKVQRDEPIRRIVFADNGKGFRPSSPVAPKMTWMDGHQSAQQLFYSERNMLGRYLELPSATKLTTRVGFGVAATGLRSDFPYFISLGRSTHIIKNDFLTYVNDAYKLHNWILTFRSSMVNDVYNREPRLMEMTNHLYNHWNRLYEEEQDEFKKSVMSALMSADLKALLRRMGETHRSLWAKDTKLRTTGVGVTKKRIDCMTEEELNDMILSTFLQWASVEMLEKVSHPGDGAKYPIKRVLSVFMALACTGPNEVPCFADGHKKCTMLHYILTHVSPSVQRTLLTQTFVNGLNVMHFASMTGWPCQMDVLLKNGGGVDAVTDLNQTALGLACRRNCTLIAKQLMWHGADIQTALCPQPFDPTEPMCPATDVYMSSKFMDTRLKELQNVMHSYLTTYLRNCDDRVAMDILAPRSTLHIIRFGTTSESKTSMLTRNVVEKRVKITLIRGKRKGPLVLFFQPVSYTRFDTTMEAQNPHIVNVPMVDGGHSCADRLKGLDGINNPAIDNRKALEDIIHNMAPLHILAGPVVFSYESGSGSREIVLKPFLEQEHNGCNYSYVIPDEYEERLTENGQIRGTLKLWFNQKVADMTPNYQFLIQAVSLNYRAKAPGTAAVIDPPAPEEPVKTKPKKNKNKNHKKTMPTGPPPQARPPVVNGNGATAAAGPAKAATPTQTQTNGNGKSKKD